MDRRIAGNIAIPLAGLLCIGLIYFFTIRPGHDWGGDFSMYIIHARNLATGRPYLETHYLTDPEIPSLQGPPSYPPLFPLLLAPVYRAYGLNYFALKLLTQSMWLVAFACLYLLAFQRLRSRGMALAVVIIFALSATVLGWKESVISDGLYLAFAMAFLWLAIWMSDEQWYERRPALAVTVLTLIVAGAYSTRAVALVLPLTVLDYEILIVRRVRRFGIYFVLGTLVALALYTRFIYNSSGYAGEFHFSPRVYAENAFYYLSAPTRLWSGCPPWIRWPLGTALSALAVTAVVRRLQKLTILEFYLAASIIPVILYHSYSDRYLLPLLAVLPIYAAEAASWLASFLETTSRRTSVAAFGLIVLIAAGLNVAHMRTGPYREGVEKPSFRELCQFVNNDTPTDSRFIFWNPRVLALYTNRTAAWYIRTNDTDRFFRFLKRIQASYVILYTPDVDDQIWLQPMILRAPRDFEMVYRNADFQVYRVSAQLSDKPARLR